MIHLRFILILLLFSLFGKGEGYGQTHAPSFDSTENKRDPTEWPANLNKNSVPHLFIHTNGNKIKTQKKYTPITLRIEGGENFSDYEGSASLRIRGNSTQSYPKKPFKIKLDKKAPLLGLAAEKNWILLANFLDPSLTNAAIAMHIGKLLNMPFLFHIIPVDVSINGVYWGSYTFCEQKEVRKKDRIQVGEEGNFFELEELFDRPPFQFKTDQYNLPVSLIYPKLEKWAEKEQAEKRFNAFKADFNSLVHLLADSAFPNNHYTDYLDLSSLADYLLVNSMTANVEFYNPRSLLMYQIQSGKYSFGPPWDFDRAYGFTEEDKRHFIHAQTPFPVFPSDEKPGAYLTWNIVQKDPAAALLLKRKWEYFKKHGFDELKVFVEEYIGWLNASGTLQRDQNRWRNRIRTTDPDRTAEEWKSLILHWLEERRDYMDKLITEL